MNQATYPNRGKSPLLRKPTPIDDATSEERIVWPDYSHEKTVIAAVEQLIEHREQHGPDAVPPQDIFASWLEENKDRFIQARRVARNRARSRNLKVTRITTRKATSCSPPFRPRERSSKSQRDPSLQSHIHRQICRIRNRICNFLSRAGAVMYPPNRVERSQLDILEDNIAFQQDHRDEFPHEDPGIFRSPAEQEQVEEGSPPLPANVESEPMHPTPTRAKRKSCYVDPFDESYTNVDVEEITSNSSGTATAFDSSEGNTSTTTPLPRQRGFHISQVAHLAPTYIAAERSRNYNRNGQSLFGTSTTSNSSRRVVQHNQLQHHHNSNKSSKGSTKDNDALRTRIRTAGLLSGEVWVDGLEGRPSDERVGVRFVARPLGKRVGLLPRARQRKESGYGLDY
ncbi:hypothetical protein F4805DRAFT_345245 [Annulohypoxylon moriforme]|nr:hypothetical protein F4805DRAFT_345245 [Annulohypoxylon moriforme]